MTWCSRPTAGSPATADMALVFFSGYTQDVPMASGEVLPGRSRGISCCRLDGETGRLELLAVTPSTPNPSYLALNRREPYLYCVNELETVDGVPASTVSAYGFCPGNGQLRLLGRQMAAGPLACFAALSHEGGHLLAASYNGGVCVLPVGADHALIAPSWACRLQGHGPDPLRQDSSHPHQVLLHPCRSRAYVSDLGADRLHCFRADWGRGWLLPEASGDLAARPGQGPRHGVFNAQGSRLYVLTELSDEIDVFDPDAGTLLQTVSAVPGDCDGPGLGAALRMHPGGRFLYASLRGPGLLAVFPVRGDGGLGEPAFYPCGGKTPRDFCLTADGRWLLAGGQDDGSVCVHALDQRTGAPRLVWRMEDAGSVTTLAVWDGA